MLYDFKDMLLLTFMVFLTEGTISTTTTSRPPLNPPKIVVYIREPEFQIVEAGGTVRYHCFERTDNVRKINKLFGKICAADVLNISWNTGIFAHQMGKRR